MTLVSRRISWIGSIGFGLTILAQLWSLPLSPTVWQDEAQIIDIGRARFEPASPATIWFDPGRAGLPQISYVGGVIVETVYRLGGETFVAPRVVNLLAAAGAALACLVWLRHMGVAASVAWVAAFWLYLDPAVERSYRGGRVDVFAVGLAFAACALIAGGQPDRTLRWRLAAAGAMAALLPWIWFPAFLLWPLIGVAVWQQAHQSSTSHRAWPATAAWLACGAVAATMAAAWPVRSELAAAVAAMAELFVFDATAPNAAAPKMTGAWAGMWASVRYAPWLPIAAVAGVCVGGRSARTIGVAAASVALVVVVSRPYLYRYVYLVPYLVVLAAFAVAHLRTSGRPWQMHLARAIVVVTLMWSAGLAIGYRTWVAFDERAGRDHERLRMALVQVVGHGTPAVYVEALEVYHAGRSLGWRMYRPTHSRIADHQGEALRRSEAAVIHAVFDSAVRRARFVEAGFDTGTRVEIPTGRPPRPLRYGGAPYGPFVVYKRVR